MVSDSTGSSLTGQVAVVTGAGSGLGRAEALALAAAGADLVINDRDRSARGVADEIEAIGGKAVLVAGDISERATADELVETAVRRFGGLHVVVNNAGMLRDRMLFSMSDEDWDDVIRVHLRGHFLLCRNAAAYWRTLAKEGNAVYGRIINTASEAFLLGPPGQANYGAAKAGIVSLTVTAARALQRYGVTANAICPRARTAMTEDVFGAAPAEGADPLGTEHVAPLVTYLASQSAAAITGQVFVVHGGKVALLAAPTIEQRFEASAEHWTQTDLNDTVGRYFADRDPAKMFAATEVLAL